MLNIWRYSMLNERTYSGMHFFSHYKKKKALINFCEEIINFQQLDIFRLVLIFLINIHTENQNIMYNIVVAKITAKKYSQRTL